MKSLNNQSNNNLEFKLNKIKLEIKELELQLNGEDPDVIVKTHIKLLHTYNERKDAAQMIIGKIAAIEKCTVKEISEKLGVEADD